MSRTFDVNFINPFLNAVVETLKTMAMTIVTPGKPYIKTDTTAKGEITGVIGVKGYAHGSFALSFPEECARNVVSAMLGEALPPYGADVRDGVGELTNMISGLARRDLAHEGMKFHASIPDVYMGEGHVVQHHAHGPVLAIPFSSPYGEITVEVCLGTN